MATASPLEMEANTAGQVQNHQNWNGTLTSNGKMKIQGNGQEGHELGTITTTTLHPKKIEGHGFPRPPSEYGDSDVPIYHQPLGAGQFYAPHIWQTKPHINAMEISGKSNGTRDGEELELLSIDEIVGIKDVCQNKRLWRMLIAEFLGTLFLVLIGCGSCLGGWTPGYAPGPVHIALTFGLAVATIAQAIGHVSAHLNPAVTIGLLAAGKCSFLKAGLYIIFQCIGAICGAAILQQVTPAEIQGTLGMTMLNEKITPVQGLFIEALITFLLVLTVCGVCDDLRKDVKGSAPLAIGLSISVCHLFAIHYTGSSMNPARTLGPAVMTKIWANHWVYWAGPLLGGFIGGFLYQVSFRERRTADKNN